MFLEGNSLALRGLLRSIEDPGIGEREGKKESEEGRQEELKTNFEPIVVLIRLGSGAEGLWIHHMRC